MKLIILLIFLISFIAESLIGKRFEPGYGVDETEGKNIARWGTVLILLFFIPGLFIFDIENNDVMKWMSISFFFTILGFQSLIEWKYLEGKKYLYSLSVMVISVITIFVSSLIYEQLTHTTFGEEMTELLSEDEQINEIKIVWFVMDNKEGYSSSSVSITDKDTISKLVEEPSEMELIKSNNVVPELDDGIIDIEINTDKSRYYITFTKGHANIGRHEYKIDKENKFLKILENEELDWKENNL
ncbi:DUF4181 domain-containing protein [Ferdinandcohnia quinoae]|uniref:DUF4181 domain-containing protein n=1 Tax=Fredinandcohnia quinoae TaxID=2918902 RepID=A0AAW5DYA9_9BACI|nr:DUF4181 domain-containing protein [Fredinandcohnia sp. SECRCQ15]MCH1625622.1 DUF4181 domain-containing protein [Fredinandcohnia sp. SECRCQ15]